MVKVTGDRKSRLVFLIAFILSFSAINVQAQAGQTIYFMDRIPQPSLLNPAFEPDHDLYIGLPGISSLNVSARSNFAKFNDLIFKHPQYDSLITILHPDADLKAFTSRLGNKNVISPEVYGVLLAFGIRRDAGYFTFSVADRASFRAALPRDLILFGLEGNEQYLGRTADFSELSGRMNYFREYAFGFSRPFGEEFSLGAKLKVLSGRAHFSFTGYDINAYTDPETYNIRLRSSFDMNFSLPVNLVRDHEGLIERIDSRLGDDYTAGNFLFGFRNPGLAVDLGAVYRPAGPWAFSASVTDLGFIRWRKDVHNLTMDQEFEYEGLDLSGIFGAGNENSFETMVDSLRGVFRMDDTYNPYMGGLTPRVYMGASYEIHPLIKLGILSRSRFWSGSLDQSLTLSANILASRWMSASFSYSAMNGSYGNIGMSMALRKGAWNFYVMSDNVKSAFLPHRTRNLNLWFGVSLGFGYAE